MGLLRLAKEEDAQEILDIYSFYITNTVVSFETEVPAREEMRERIRSSLAAYCWLVWEEDGKVGGYAYASRHHKRAAYRWAVDVSIYVGEKWQGKGVGKALYSALFLILRRQGYYNAYACICLPNAGSVGIHEYFGFKKIAHFTKVGYKFGAWWDTGWWELFLQDKSVLPSEPLALAQVNREEIRRLLDQG
jgi:L-amino acid N-acyltransferase YncA